MEDEERGGEGRRGVGGREASGRATKYSIYFESEDGGEGIT